LSHNIAWWTDIHFELLDPEQRAFTRMLWKNSTADCAILTGDLSHGNSTLDELHDLATRFGRPIYFVLGNHDFYGTSIARRRIEATHLAAAVDNLIYLTTAEIVSLTNNTALVGHDGWGDGRAGDFTGTPVRPPDLTEIADLAQAAHDRDMLATRLQKLGDETAQHLARVLPQAAAHHRQVIVATHVPPFPNATWYNGQNSTAQWLPHFCCHAAGTVLVDMAERFPNCQWLVLCGHSHGDGEIRVRENLRVLTAGAEPCLPQMAQALELA